MADGTAQQCGRVGSRHIFFKTLQVYLKGFLLHILNETIQSYLQAGARMVLLEQCGSLETIEIKCGSRSQ